MTNLENAGGWGICFISCLVNRLCGHMLNTSSTLFARLGWGRAVMGVIRGFLYPRYDKNFVFILLISLEYKLFQ